MKRNWTRRSFLRDCGAAFAGASAVGSLPAPATGAVLGANEKIRVGLIGAGGMGRGDLRTFLMDDRAECSVVCDVDDAQIARAVATVEKERSRKPDAVKDFRRVCERQDVDVCLVATPDHWHAIPSIHACAAGKDVYCEKPLATSIGEGRAIARAARKHDRVVQVGTQWRSGQHYQDAVAYVKSGALGKIRVVRVWACLHWVGSIGRPADSDPPAGVDYDLWLGPAPKRPFNPMRFHFNFRWFWDYAGGLQTDWGVHLVNIAQWAMGVEYPLSVASTGGKYQIDDMQETPDTQCTVFEYPGFAMMWDHQVAGVHGVRGREHGVAFDGERGTLVVDAHGWEVIPGTKKEIEPKEAKATPGPRLVHVRNFLDCCQSRKRPNTDIEIGHRATSTCLLGNVALHTGTKVRWDGEAERAIDNPAANELLTKPYRSPWTLEV